MSIYLSLHHPDGSEVDARGYRRAKLPLFSADEIDEDGNIIFSNTGAISFQNAMEDWGEVSKIGFSRSSDPSVPSERIVPLVTRYDIDWDIAAFHMRPGEMQFTHQNIEEERGLLKRVRELLSL